MQFTRPTSEGSSYFRLRVNERGAWMLEMAARSIGGLCSRALRFGDGVSLEELVMRHALGEDVAGFEREGAASGVMMLPIPRSGILLGVNGIEQARRVPGIENVRITIPAGQRLVPLPEGARYLGFLFAKGDVPSEVEEALRAAHAQLTFDIEPDDAGLSAVRTEA